MVAGNGITKTKGVAEEPIQGGLIRWKDEMRVPGDREDTGPVGGKGSEGRLRLGGMSPRGGMLLEAADDLMTSPGEGMTGLQQEGLIVTVTGTTMSDTTTGLVEEETTGETLIRGTKGLISGGEVAVLLDIGPDRDPIEDSMGTGRREDMKGDLNKVVMAGSRPVDEAQIGDTTRKEGILTQDPGLTAIESEALSLATQKSTPHPRIGTILLTSRKARLPSEASLSILASRAQRMLRQASMDLRVVLSKMLATLTLDLTKFWEASTR